MPAESWADLLANAGDAADSFEIIPVGDYDVTVTEASVDFAKSSGNKMYKLTLEIEAGPYAGRKLWRNLSVGDSIPGTRMFFKQMAALTLDGSFFKNEPTDDAIVEALVGKRASAQVVHGTWNEQPKADVKFLNRPKGPAPAGSGVASSNVGGLGLDAPPVADVAAADAPAVSATPPAPDADPWVNASAPSMPGLGQEDPF